MKVLGVETSTMMMGVALLDESGLRAEYRALATRSRSEGLLPMMERVLRESQCAPEDLGGLALSIGPGSFTGLRIGVSIAKGFAFGLGLPIVGVSTLKALATPAAMGRGPYPICTMMDAKRGEVYAAVFRPGEKGDLMTLVEEEVITPAGLIDQVGALGEPVIFLGTGAVLYQAELGTHLGDRAIFIQREDPYPAPSVIARLGRERLLAGGEPVGELTPRYLSRFEPKASAGRRGGR